jgi:hypothetical protein
MQSQYQDEIYGNGGYDRQGYAAQYQQQQQQQPQQQQQQQQPMYMPQTMQVPAIYSPTYDYNQQPYNQYYNQQAFFPQQPQPQQVVNGTYPVVVVSLCSDKLFV